MSGFLIDAFSLTFFIPGREQVKEKQKMEEKRIFCIRETIQIFISISMEKRKEGGEGGGDIEYNSI